MKGRREKDLTVAICTYNGASRLPNVLDRLRVQEQVQEVAWEVIVVDNNSSDDTAEVVRCYQSDWPASCPIRYIFEPTQGKTHAVRRAFEEANGAFVGFLDDDNVPATDWVAAVCAFGEEHPHAGAYGGCIYPEYEEEPPKGVEGIEGLFAVVRREKAFTYPPGGPLGRMFAPGAGLVVRRQAWRESMPEQLALSGPRGASSMGLHEDMEMQWYIHRSGWEVWHNPHMVIRHRLPPRRFEEEYLMRFFRELALSRYRYRMLVHEPWRRPVMVVAYMVSDFIKLMQVLYRNRGTSEDSIAARCRRRMRTFMLISPFYHWTASLRRSR